MAVDRTRELGAVGNSGGEYEGEYEGRFWGGGGFSERSPSSPDPFSRRAAGVRVGSSSKLYAPVRWARFPVAWLWSRRLTEPPRPLRCGGTNPSARISRAPPLSGEALQEVPSKGSLRRGDFASAEAGFRTCGHDQRALRSPFENLHPCGGDGWKVAAALSAAVTTT